MDLLHWSQERIQSCIDQLEIEKYQTAVEAKKVADDWYDTLQQKDEDARSCYAKIRVKLSGNSLEAQWRQFYMRGSKIIIRAIAKPLESYSYSIKTFKDTKIFPEWIRDYAIETEAKLTRKRLRVRAISDMQKILKHYQKYLEDENYF